MFEFVKLVRYSSVKFEDEVFAESTNFSWNHCGVIKTRHRFGGCVAEIN